MNTRIRPATIEDRQGLWQVHTQAIRQSTKSHYTAQQIEAWAGRLIPEYYTPNPEVFVVAVADDGSIIGFGELNLEKGEIEAVFVAPDYGRHGIGRRLLQFLEDIATQHGRIELILDASLNAVGFYEHMGYRQTMPTVQTYSKDAVSLSGMLMAKNLLHAASTGDDNGSHS